MKTLKKINKMADKLEDKIERIIEYVSNIQPDESDWSDWSDRQYYRNQKENALRELYELRGKIDDIYNMSSDNEVDE